MMLGALITIHVLLFFALAAAIAAPGLRRGVAAVLLGIVGLVCLGAGVMEGSVERTLDITHRFSAYVDLKVENKEFAIETTRAPGYVWGLVTAAFALCWAAWLGLACPRPADKRRVGALGEPLALAWTGAALQIGIQKAAAPMFLLGPFDLAPDRVLFPATLAAAFLLARPGRKILHLFLYLTLFIAVTRLPLAVFGTLATRGAWGTHLDVHNTVYFVPPGAGTEIGAIETAAGGNEQLFWLIWAPHLIVYPFFYLMSTGGFSFLRLMIQRQHAANAREASRLAAE